MCHGPEQETWVETEWQSHKTTQYLKVPLGLIKPTLQQRRKDTTEMGKWPHPCFAMEMILGGVRII